MAKKLRSADADRNRKSTAEAFEESVKESEQPERKKPGRKPSREPLQLTSFKLPASRIAELKELASFYQMNQTQYLAKLISDDYISKKDQLKALEKMREK